MTTYRSHSPRVLSCLAAVVAAAVITTNAADHFPVTHVIDGDTIDVATAGRVRLLGIDAPEVGVGYDTPAAFGLEAREYLKTLVAHRYVRLEADNEPSDAYGRRLSYVIRDDGLFVNAEMLR